MVKKYGYCQRRPIEWFVEKAKSVHGDKYDYSNVAYIDNRTHVTITCRKCGNVFKIIPFNHFDGSGCRPCAHANLRKSADDFLKQARQIHGEDYDYSGMKYVDTKTKINIKCNKCGKTFLQSPNLHISQSTGCPNCISSHGEKRIAAILKFLGVQYEKEYTLPGCVGVGGKHLRFDFYIPSTNTCIEYDGRQHYDKNSKFWSERVEEHDRIKNDFCEVHGIKLRRINKTDFKKIESILAEFVHAT